MLKIKVPALEVFDEASETFDVLPETTLVLEHSLSSISKWESIWLKPFLSRNKMTDEEMLSYIECMCVDGFPDRFLLEQLTEENQKSIVDYIGAPMTATKFHDQKKPVGNSVVTSEVIYYQMISCGIPLECEHWHINRLTTLIQVFATQNAPKKKMSKQQLASRNRELNAARRAKLGTTG